MFAKLSTYVPMLLIVFVTWLPAGNAVPARISSQRIPGSSTNTYAPDRFLASSTALAAVSIPACNGLLRNNSFEDGFFGPSDWNSDAWNGNGSQAAFAWDDTQHSDGNKSVKIDLATPNDARWLQTVAVQPNTAYVLRGMIKTQNVAHTAEPTDAGANLSLYGTWTRSEGLFGTNDWTPVSLPFNSGANTQITIGVRLGYWAGTTTGTAWFDALCLGQTGGLSNPDFELGSSNVPSDWQSETVSGSATFDWDATTAHTGSHSIKVAAAAQSIARWTQTVLVDPDSEYELSGWVKTSGVQGSGGAKVAAAGLDGSALAAATPALTGAHDWTEVSVRFITGRATAIKLSCTLGEEAPYREATSSGTLWCDDLALTKIQSLPRTSQSGQHLALDVYTEDWTFNDPTTYITHLDEVHDAMVDLVGTAPYNGARITVRSDASMYVGLLAGNPIRIGPGGGWAAIVNSNGMDFGVPHELGHDFDFAPAAPLYVGSASFDNGEQWANFKVLYAFDTLGPRYPTLKIPWGGTAIALGQVGQRFIDERGAQNWINQGRTDYQNMSNDVYTGLLYTLVKRLGWAPFKCVFRVYHSGSTPVPSTAEAKVALWANTLSTCANVDVTPDFRSWGFPVQRTPVNILANPDFELDANGDGKPDSWSTNNRVTRSNLLVHSGSYAMRHSASNNASYTIAQTIPLPKAQQYTFSGWVNIPATSDAFTFALLVEWRDTKNRVITTNTLKTYTGPTSGWDHVSVVIGPPASATSANLQMVVSSLNATIYVDDFAFRW
jgi:hypothetical protein